MRKTLLERARRVVVKVGSGVIAAEGLLEEQQVEEIARGVCRLLERNLEVLLVSSGAVAAGKGALGINGRPATIPLKQAAAAVGQSRLMRAYKEAFGHEERLVAQILLTRDDLGHRRRYLNARNTLMTLLEHKVTPVINENDTVVVEEIRFGDNDNLSALVCQLAEADLLVILSDVDGLYDKDPVKHPDATLIPEVAKITPEVEAMAGAAATLVGTGGMQTKLQAARTATRSGVATLIVNGRDSGVLERVFAGEELGTLFLPNEKRMAARKHWIAFSKRPRGSLFLDDGACRAVAGGGKSLLPSGVSRFEGGFERGDAVKLCNLEGEEFARGVIGYSHLELARIAGHNSSEIEALLGYKYGDEIIHRDNLVLK
ncbi:MAG: glutamate 5-kinase [Desulfuromonas sp.]|mgnify:CR=1 FL=1|nr:MAG: glutamate 5-kinase [Desulfuromonas sp.]